MKKSQFTPAQKRVLISLITEDYSNIITTDNYRSVEKLIKMGILKMVSSDKFDFRLPNMRNWFECWSNEINK